MPKLGKAFDDHLHILCNSPLREALVALSILEGDDGEYSRVTRNLLQRALDDHLLDLPPRERAKYDQILEAVQARSVIRRQERGEFVRKKLDSGQSVLRMDKENRI